MESSLDQFTFNSRPAAAKFQPGCKDQGRPDKEQFKYTVIICNNTCSVCQYCHIKIKQQDLMLMTKSQRTTNDATNTPCFYGFHCDCFFLSSNVLKSSAELYGFNSLSKYHRHYIARKISKSHSKVSGSREMPGDLKVGYSILDRRFNYYCEQCNMAMLASDIKIAGILKKHSDLVVYHPRCFSQAFERYPVKLQGLEKLLPYDISGLKSMLNITSSDTSRVGNDYPASRVGNDYPTTSYNNKYQSKSTPIENVMKFKTSKDAFFWPRDNSSSGPTTMEEENTASSSSSSGDKIWDSLHPSRQQPPNNPSYKSFRSKPSSFDDLIRNHSNKNPDSVRHAIPNSPRTAEFPRKRRTSFKPNTDHSNSRWSIHGSDPKKTVNPPKREQSHESCKTSDSHSEYSKKCDLETSEQLGNGKVELKKSTIRSEITKILYKYNHDYITSKIVRTMLMQKFGCDLTPHKKFIDDTIMELLDIIDNNPINLKSIPGRVFVDEGEIEDIATSPPPAVSTTSPTPIMSPMSANIDDISPFAIMSNQAEEIALSNVDDSVNVNSSKGAWGDKSNSPKNKGKDKIDKKREQVREEEQEDSLTKYALSAADKPINLCECCLCCFRIQTLEEIVSLYNHVKTKHEGECTCAVCDIKFKDVYTLMLHVAEFHRANKCFKCKNCRRSFNHHADLSKHLDFCYLSSDSEDLEDLEESPVNSPRKKKTKFEKGPPGMPELVSTLKSTQNTLDKIKTFITSESSPYEDL